MSNHEDSTGRVAGLSPTRLLNPMAGWKVHHVYRLREFQPDLALGLRGAPGSLCLCRSSGSAGPCWKYESDVPLDQPVHSAFTREADPTLASVRTGMASRAMGQLGRQGFRGDDRRSPPREVVAYVSDTTPLIGMSLLRRHNLNVDVEDGGQVSYRRRRSNFGGRPGAHGGRRLVQVAGRSGIWQLLLCADSPQPYFG